MMVMQRSWALVLLLAINRYPALAETEYSRSAELPPLRISFDDLQAVLDKEASFMNSANDSAPLSREVIILRKGEFQIKGTGHQLVSNDTKVPKSIDSFEYTAYVAKPVPITWIMLNFRDYSRSLFVEGQSPEQVDALFSTLRDDLYKLSTPIGGPLIRFWRGPVIFGLIWLVARLIVYYAFEKRHPRALPPIAICIVLLGVLLLLPINDLFAGFSAIQGDASFMVRYGPQITFWGVVAGLLASFIPWFVSCLSKGADKASNDTGNGTRRRGKDSSPRRSQKKDKEEEKGAARGQVLN